MDILWQGKQVSECCGGIFMPTEFIERRMSPRTGLSLLTRIRPVDSAFPVEHCTSINVSHSGVYFKTSSAYYLLGMEVYVTSDFVLPGPNREEIMGAVVRIDKLEGSGFGVAIHLLPAI
jgi:hypothetical protein